MTCYWMVTLCYFVNKLQKLELHNIDPIGRDWLCRLKLLV